MKKLLLTLDKPRSGWWDGGAKQRGMFEVEGCHKQSEEHTCFGSWEFNFFFNVKTGRSEKETLSRAKRYLKRHTTVPHTLEEVEVE